MNEATSESRIASFIFLDSLEPAVPFPALIIPIVVLALLRFGLAGLLGLALRVLIVFLMARALLMATTLVLLLLHD